MNIAAAALSIVSATDKPRLIYRNDSCGSYRTGLSVGKYGTKPKAFWHHAKTCTGLGWSKVTYLHWPCSTPAISKMFANVLNQHFVSTVFLQVTHHAHHLLHLQSLASTSGQLVQGRLKLHSAQFTSLVPQALTTSPAACWDYHAKAFRSSSLKCSIRPWRPSRFRLPAIKR